MIGSQFRVDALVELAVAGVAETHRLVASVVLGKLLFDDIRLDGDSEMVRLSREVGGDVVILVLHEGRITKVAPENGRHAEFVSVAEGFRYLDDLVVGVLAAEVNGCPNGRRTHVVGLVDRAEHDLAGDIRVGEEFVVVDLHQEGNVVGVLASHAS